MDEKQIIDETMVFFEALANVERLKLAGVLANQPQTVEQLAQSLNLAPASIYRHLELLEGLSLGQRDGQLYRWDAKALEDLSRRGHAGRRPQADLSGFEGPDFDRKVFKTFMDENGRFKALPNQQKKLMVILKYLCDQFEVGVRYSEKQVNEILARFYPDTASLRRNLVDSGLLAREVGGGEYWRVG